MAHKGEKPFKCTELGCYKAYRRKSHLIGHVETHHVLQPKTFTCKLCQKHFLYSYHLARHVEAYHHDNLPLRCEHCESFKCEKQFQLFKHWADAHNITLPHECSECGTTVRLFIKVKETLNCSYDSSL